MPHSYEHRVTAAEVDAVDHLNNAAYLQIFEAARWDVLRASGVDAKALIAGGVSPVIVAIDLSFRREVRLDEVVVVQTTYEPLAPRRILTRQEMVGADGETRAVAQLWSTFFDLRTRKAVDPPEAVYRACGIDPDAVPASAPIVQGLGGAFLYADDAPALSDWYQTHLGLEMQNWGMAWGVELPSADRVRGTRIATTTFAIFPSATPMPAVRTGRVNFRVADLDRTVAALVAAGVRMEPGPQDHGRFAWIWDPEGNKVELWEPPKG